MTKRQVNEDKTLAENAKNSQRMAKCRADEDKKVAENAKNAWAVP